MIPKLCTFSLVSLISVFLTGCGGGSTSGGGTIDQGNLALTEMAGMLKQLPLDKMAYPLKMSDIDQVEPMIPTAAPLIKKGEIIYVWGAAMNDASDKVVVYEKKVESESGWVLLQNGTVKKMTADAFKAAPKAAKK